MPASGRADRVIEIMLSRKRILAGFALTLAVVWTAPAETAYQKPPKNVLDVLHAPLPPAAVIDPTHRMMLLVARVRYPPIADLAEPMLRLAGARVIPKTRRLQDAPYGNAYELVELPGGAQRHIALPPNARVGLPVWSADGRHFAFSNVAQDAIELWIGDAASAKLQKIDGVKLNPMLGNELAVAAGPEDRPGQGGCAKPGRGACAAGNASGTRHPGGLRRERPQ